MFKFLLEISTCYLGIKYRAIARYGVMVCLLKNDPTSYFVRQPKSEKDGGIGKPSVNSAYRVYNKVIVRINKKNNFIVDSHCRTN